MSQPISIPPGGGPPQPAGDAVSVVEATSSGSDTEEKKSKKKITGPRRVRLALTRIDPWSVMKASFLLSFAAGVMVIVATAFTWLMLDAMRVFSTIEDLARTVAGEDSNAFTALMTYLQLPRALAMSTIVAVVNMILITALATVGAFLYNITATLVGGIHLTLADE